METVGLTEDDGDGVVCRVGGEVVGVVEFDDKFGCCNSLFNHHGIVPLAIIATRIGTAIFPTTLLSFLSFDISLASNQNFHYL